MPRSDRRRHQRPPPPLPTACPPSPSRSLQPRTPEPRWSRKAQFQQLARYAAARSGRARDGATVRRGGRPPGSATSSARRLSRRVALLEDSHSPRARRRGSLDHPVSGGLSSRHPFYRSGSARGRFGMQCPGCRHENRAHARFCEACGTPLGRTREGGSPAASYTDLERALFKELEARKRELTEALEGKTATGEILQVISRSPTEVQPVFDAVVTSAARLCEAHDVAMLLVEGHDVRPVAGVGPLRRWCGSLCHPTEPHPPPERANVAFYEAAGRVNSVCGCEMGSVHGWPVAVGLISRGSVSLLFALIKDELREPVGAGGDSRGGGAIYAAALRQRPSDISRSPTHRTCERPEPALSGRRRHVHMFTRAAAVGRRCRMRWGSNTPPSRSRA